MKHRTCAIESTLSHPISGGDEVVRINLPSFGRHSETGYLTIPFTYFRFGGIPATSLGGLLFDSSLTWRRTAAIIRHLEEAGSGRPIRHSRNNGWDYRRLPFVRQEFILLSSPIFCKTLTEKAYRRVGRRDRGAGRSMILSDFLR